MKKKKMKVNEIASIFIAAFIILTIALLITIHFKNKQILILETKLEVSKENEEKNMSNFEKEIYRSADLQAKLNLCEK